MPLELLVRKMAQLEVVAPLRDAVDVDQSR